MKYLFVTLFSVLSTVVSANTAVEKLFPIKLTVEEGLAEASSRNREQETKTKKATQEIEKKQLLSILHSLETIDERY